MMSTKQYVLRGFNTLENDPFGAKFFKTDLHFHTPASEDARGSNRYKFNPYKRKYPANKESPTYPEQVRKIHDKILAAAVKIAKQIVDRFLALELSMVAVTDHNSIGTVWSDHELDRSSMDLAAPTWYELIDDEAAKVNRERGKQVLTILPGVEISTTGVHILGVFQPQSPRRKVHFIICDLLNEIGFQIDDWGKNPKVGSASVIDTINQIVQRGGIAIPAHVDARNQALFELYKLTGGSMKRVLSHESLSAVEIVNPKKFERLDPKLKKTLKQWIDNFRYRAGRTSLAYLQGSDAHDLNAIGKRHAYLKMTRPSFSGLRVALEMPSSRVRISDVFKKSSQGLYVFGLKIENNYFGKRHIRFNRHLNCVVGKKGTGKTGLRKLMQAAVDPQTQLLEGKVSLIVEKIVDAKRLFYAFYRAKNQQPRCYQIEPVKKQAKALDFAKAKQLNVIPKLYKAGRIDQIIQSEKEVHDFIIKYFGDPSAQSVRRFNKIFAISRFLEQKAEPLLELAVGTNGYQLSMNTRWGSGKKRMKKIFTLSHSMRKTALMSMIIIMSEFGPSIIDAPEADFDNSDITNFLVPIIKLYKDFQQVTLFTNNPILAVNADPDNYILLNSTGTKLKDINQGFAIDDKAFRPLLLDIIEGGLKTLQDRSALYQIRL
jgi:hypothetical protein